MGEQMGRDMCTIRRVRQHGGGGAAQPAHRITRVMQDALQTPPNASPVSGTAATRRTAGTVRWQREGPQPYSHGPYPAST